jgi:hypothetical protein
MCERSDEKSRWHRPTACYSLPRTFVFLLAASSWFVPNAVYAQDSVEWRFQGKIVDHNPAGEQPLVHEFDRSGTDGDAIEFQSGNTSTARFMPNAQANAGTHTLKSGATIDAFVEDWEGMTALGYARASYSDRLTVQSGGSGGGFLAFTWSVDGKLSATANAGATGGLVFLNYAVNTELFVQAHAQNEEVGVRESIFHERITRGSLSESEAECFQPINSAAILRLFDPSIHHDQRTFDQGAFNSTVLVPFQVNQEAELTVNLFTCSTFYASQYDIGLVNFLLAAEFQNSASLQSVQVLDENMQPLAAPFQLISANGLTYPLVQVPEPSGALLALTAAAFSAFVFRRARQSSRR